MAARPIAISATIGLPLYIPTPAVAPAVGSVAHIRRCFGTPLDRRPGFFSPGLVSLPGVASPETDVDFDMSSLASGLRAGRGAFGGVAFANASGSADFGASPLSSAMGSSCSAVPVVVVR